MSQRPGHRRIAVREAGQMSGLAEQPHDEYLWLEHLDNPAATDWARERSAEAMAALAGGADFERLRDQLREALDAPERIPLTIWRGEHLYNLWQDAAHPRGLWRRATLGEYRAPQPRWEVLLDIDQLAADEGEPWVWQSSTVLRPEGQRALISLSRGGSDACVVREFNLDTHSFVDGFTLPEAKTAVSWIDSDHIYVATDFGPDSLTSSGYPRIVKRWRRGTPLSEAVHVYAGEHDDVIVVCERDHSPGFIRDLVIRHIDFFRSEKFLLDAGRDGDVQLRRIDVPTDADIMLHREWLLVRPRSAWSVAGATYPAGSLLAAPLDDVLDGDAKPDVLFEPDQHTSLRGYSRTRDHILLSTLDDVRGRLDLITHVADEGWRRSSLLPPSDSAPYLTIDVIDTNSDLTNEYLVLVSGFTQPPALHYGVAAHDAAGTTEVIRRQPDFFDPAGLVTAQHFATSADGTKVPYFVVGPTASHDARLVPTLLTGYGGFEHSLTPGYDPVIGRGWLARGGNYVVANIRGGGEYGPRWHHAALRENRLRAYEDFAAVASDLVGRGIAGPTRLAIHGGSNGGLLMGVMLTRYPELFAAVEARAPLFDMRRYHLLLAGASWMAEYGDPDDEGDWSFLRQYSPYHNLRPDPHYPPMLVIASTRDDRVHPAHARKMVARLRDLGQDVSYYEIFEGGHSAAADHEQAAFNWALALEFLWHRLGDDRRDS